MPSPISDNPFLDGYTLAELADLQTQYKQCLRDIATAGKSYVINGRTFTRADLDEVKKTSRELGQAVTWLNRQSRPTIAYPYFR